MNKTISQASNISKIIVSEKEKTTENRRDRSLNTVSSLKKLLQKKKPLN